MLTLTFFETSELSTITKSDLISDFLIGVGDTALLRFSLLVFLRSLRVRVVKGETISRSLDVSTSMFMAERATCERLADLPACASKVVNEACIELGMNRHTMGSLLNSLESFLRYPVGVIQGFGSETPYIGVRSDHSANQFLDTTRHLVAADPFTANLTGFSSSTGRTMRIKLTVRVQYFSRSSLVENCSPSTYSNGVRPMRISKNVIPSDQTSDLRVSWWWPRARSGERY